MAEMRRSANDFIFSDLIGEGSFSMVYLAKEVGREGELAIKVCEKRLIRRERKEKAVFREKKSLELLIANPSPFFIRLLCTFQDDNRLFFVMNFAKKGELLSLINDRQRFDQNCARFYSAEILLALEHLHRLGIIHRDLKPENILLSERMHIQVTDFGSALILSDINTETNNETNNTERRNSFVGTAHYVSPEMLTNKKATTSSDVWAFGCILYQMICGSTPFRAPNEYLMFQKILNLEYDFSEEFTDSAKNLIKNVLQKTPSERLGANDDLLNDGYISIKSDPFFTPFTNIWDILHDTVPPVSPNYINNSLNNEIKANSSVPENIEPGLAERQITRIMGLALHEDYDESNANKKKGILDITAPEMKERLAKQSKENEFHRYVEDNLILKHGFIEKKKGLFARRRMFLLTTGPHLYYVDAANHVLKGQIPWSKDMRAEPKNFKNFFVHTPNRSYILEDMSGSAPEWCRVIEEVRDATFGPPSVQNSSDICNTNLSIREGQNQERLYWDIQLDPDLLETIANLYPEWFKENSFNTMTDDSDSSSLLPFLESNSISIPSEAGSPPKAGSPVVDHQSIKNSMDKNKESLKVKLMLRRPINQLIEQGILPPLRASAGFHEQKQKLERAKTGDFLKHKIQRRPQRQELIEQHILEDTTVDPSLHEKQRQLKKARLADDLNDRLSHRPGPLELIKGNILHTDEPFEQAVKEGQIPFKKTCEGEVIKHPPPRFIFTTEEESSSDSASSPLVVSAEQSLSGLITFEAPNEVPTTSTVPTVVATTCPQTTNVSYIVSSPVTSILTSPSTVHSILIGNGNAVAIASPTPTPSVVTVASATTAPIINGSPFATSNQISVNPSVVSSFKEHSSSGSKCRKKAKSKAQPKARTIKFHEYKGPPNAKSQSNSSQSSNESSYELLLQQQQLFLQWQLEWQQKYPQIILPTAQKTCLDQSQDQGSDAQSAANSTQTNAKPMSSQNAFKNSFQTKSISQSVTNNDSNGSVGSPRDRSNSNASTTQSKFNSPVVGKIISKLEDMKVSDLKAELKKRNLPVSGPKQQLIDRLKPFADAVMATAIANSTFITMGSPNHSMNTDISDTKPVVMNGDIVKTETTDSLPTSPSLVMGSPIDCNSNDVKTEPMDIKSPENQMEVDINNEDVDQSCAMDLETEGSVQKNSQTNEEIVLIQQQKINELQRELQKSQMQLQLQQTTVLPIESQTVAIPLTNGPQIHIISAQNTEPSIDVSQQQKSLQRQLLQQHLQQKLQQNLNIRPQTAANETNLATILTNGTISPSVKASLAAFLQSQQQTQPQTLTTKLIGGQSVTPIQQFVLCPTLCATTDSVSEEPDCGKQRTNSLPNGLSHKFLSQSSQRTSSLPNFNTLVSTQSTAEPSNRPELKPNLIITKCPPNYDEATKQMNKSKDKKKSIKSQAVDDVLEILIKNGELPPSAAQDPTTPTTPEKQLSLKTQTNPLFTKTEKCESNAKQLENNCLNNNINNKLIVNNSNNNINDKTSAQNNTTLDFDFILDLEGLAEAMDLNVGINEKGLKCEKGLSNNDNNNNNNNNNNSINNSYQSQCNKNQTNSELSLTEFMDFQGCHLNVEDNHWMDMASTSVQNNEQNLLHYNESEDQNHSNMSFDSNNNTNGNNCGQNSMAGTSVTKSESKHDPILPNTMFGGNLVDPLGDLFFDDSDFKSSLDLGSLMWDKVDFAT